MKTCLAFLVCIVFLMPSLTIAKWRITRSAVSAQSVIAVPEDALTCYECGPIDPYCESPGIFGYILLRTCVDPFYGHCYKTRVGNIILRGCISDCEEFVRPLGYGVYCCETNGCNTASTLVPAARVITAFTSASLIVTVTRVI